MSLQRLEEIAEAAMALAVVFPPEDGTMQHAASGLHPYRAALFFLLREMQNGNRAARYQRSAVRAASIDRIANWQTVRCLGHMFDKQKTQVARDLVDLYRDMENSSAP